MAPRNLNISLVNLLTAIMLHPSTLSVFLARPAFDYRLQTILVWAIVAATICTSIIDVIASFASVIPPTVSLTSVLASLLNFMLLLRVAAVSRKWNLSNSKGTWVALAMLQLPALAIAIMRAWSPSTPLNIAIRFSLLIWTTGTLVALSSKELYTCYFVKLISGCRSHSLEPFKATSLEAVSSGPATRFPYHRI